MSTSGVIDIDQVPVDIDPLERGVLTNPLKEDFTHAYAGKSFTIPAGGSLEQSLPVVVHLAKHLAEKIVRDEFRKRVTGIKDVKTKDIESSKPIPDYKGKIWEKMKELVSTESNFFLNPKEGEESNKEKFIR